MNKVPNANRCVLALKFLLASAVVSGLFLTPRAFAADDARKIMEQVYRQDTSHDATLHASLEIFDKTGHAVKKPFLLLRLGSPGDSKTLLRFKDPPEIRGVTLLSINRTGERAGENDRQWIFLPATKRARSVAPRERSERFAGSDFTYEDIAERVLDDFSYRLLSDSETMDGRAAFKIEATPVDSGRSQYKFVYHWVAKDIPCILLSEMYDKDGRKVRVLHASQFKKVSGIWGPRHTEMNSLLDQTRTVLSISDAHFNTGLSADLFTPQALSGNLPGETTR